MSRRPRVPPHGRGIGTLAAVALLIGVSACDVTRPPGAVGCQRYVDPLTTEFAAVPERPLSGAFGEVLTLSPQMTLTGALQRALTAPERQGDRSIDILALSGGGQWGAFGAGFLNGWSRADAAARSQVERNEIDIVTGISTGAIMSSYAFLGSAWDERLSEVYLGTGPEGPDGIRENPVSDEVLFERHGLLTTFFSNAATDPRGGLDTRVRQAVAELVADIAATGEARQLFVGAVSLNDGAFKIFSLKPLAQDIARARQQGRVEEVDSLEACYAEMLLASAAVPFLFPPRFIDSQAYVDGGARFGAFIRSVDLLSARLTEVQRPTEGNIFVVVNGDLSVRGVSEIDNSTLGVSLRSVEAIIDQINRDSIFRIENDAANGETISWKTQYVFVTDRTCREAHLDAAEAGDNEFDPHFMKCLYDLGLSAGEEQRWRPYLYVPHFQE